MKTRWIILALICCAAIALYLRIALPFANVFTGDYIKFISIDAYYQMFFVDQMAPDFPAYITKIFSAPSFAWLLSGVIYCIGLGNPTQSTIDTVAVYFPPILAALTIVPVYFIGKVLFNRFVGVVAAVLIAILPGEWLGRSLLGFTDHHVAEVLFSTVAFMFAIYALKTRHRRRIVYSILALLFMIICVHSFGSGVLVAGVIMLWLIYQAAIFRDKYSIIAASAIALLAIIYIGINNTLIPVMWNYLTASLTVTTTLEMRPLFSPQGYFTPVVAWGNFGMLLFIVPVAMAILFMQPYSKKKNKKLDQSAMLLFGWSIIMLAAALSFRRFAYYFAINASLLGAFFVYYLYKRIKIKEFAMAVVAIALMAMIIPNYNSSVITAKYSSFAPSDAWLKGLHWIKENTERDSLILSWWDYGYWIQREADRSAYVTPSQDRIPIENTAKMFLSQSDNNTVSADYIIIDRDMVLGKFWAIATWAGDEPEEYSEVYYIVKDKVKQPVLLFYPEYYESVLVRLYNFNGEEVTPTQSIVIKADFMNRVLQTLDIYPSYDEALSNCGVGERIVGTMPFNSPVPLNEVKNIVLVYQSEKTVDGVAELKIYRGVQNE